MIQASLVGRLTRDPHMGTTKNGKAVCNFDIACTTKDRNADGTKRTQFTRVTVWGSLGESCGRYLRKGRLVFCIGQISTEAYMSNDGNPKSALTMTADNVEFLTMNDGPEMEPEPAPTQIKQEARVEQEGFIAVDDSDDLPF